MLNVTHSGIVRGDAFRQAGHHVKHDDRDSGTYSRPVLLEFEPNETPLRDAMETLSWPSLVLLASLQHHTRQV